MGKKSDGHPIIRGPIDLGTHVSPVLHWPTASAGLISHPGFSLKVQPVAPRARVLDLPAPLKEKERGAVLQFGLRYQKVGSDVEPVISGKDGEAAWRAALLLAERVEWPITNHVMAATADPGGLTSAGVMTRSPVMLEGQATLEQINHVPFTVFEALEAREPGRWSIWAGTTEQPIPAAASAPDLAFRLKINRALLIPDTEVPYVDLVEFRKRHEDKVVKLRHHIERMAIQVARNGWNSAEANLEVEALDAALANYLEEARKPNWKKVVANLEFSMNWTGLGKGATIAGLGYAAGMPLVGALLGLGEALSSSMEIKSVRGLKRKLSESPFEYLAEIDRKFGD